MARKKQIQKSSYNTFGKLPTGERSTSILLAWWKYWQSCLNPPERRICTETGDLRAIAYKYGESHKRTENLIFFYCAKKTLLVNYFEKYAFKVPASSHFCEIQESSKYGSINQDTRWNLSKTVHCETSVGDIMAGYNLTRDKSSSLTQISTGLAIYNRAHFWGMI